MAKRKKGHGKRRKHLGKGLRSYLKSKSPAAKAKRRKAARKAARTRARHKKSYRR